MGISFYMILQSPSTEFRKKAIAIFCTQLFLNFCWSFIFFKFQLLGLAFTEIIIMWVSILTMIIIFFEINKKAAIIQIPYLLWVSFASVLNGSIWFLN
jgi:tryptophan-rich sensory protein